MLYLCFSLISTSQQLPVVAFDLVGPVALVAAVVQFAVLVVPEVVAVVLRPLVAPPELVVVVAVVAVGFAVFVAFVVVAVVVGQV